MLPFWMVNTGCFDDRGVPESANCDGCLNSPYVMRFSGLVFDPSAHPDISFPPLARQCSCSEQLEGKYPVPVCEAELISFHLLRVSSEGGAVRIVLILLDFLFTAVQGDVQGETSFAAGRVRGVNEDQNRAGYAAPEWCRVDRTCLLGPAFRPLFAAFRRRLASILRCRIFCRSLHRTMRLSECLLRNPYWCGFISLGI